MNVGTKGNKKTLMKRFKNIFKPKPIPLPVTKYRYYLALDFEATCIGSGDFEYPNEITKPIPLPVTKYRYYLALDFEATCIGSGDFEYPNEIIEFPVLIIDAETHDIIDTFHRHVKPTLNPVLSQFCIELTGITQSQVDNSNEFVVVLQEFEEWLSGYSEYPFMDCLFVTDGPWDIRDFIRKQCESSGITRPEYMMKWFDIRSGFSKLYRKRENLDGMLRFFGLKFEGRPHCGLDDTKNVGRILQRFVKDGRTIKENGRIKS